jgi:putative endonuclease
VSSGKGQIAHAGRGKQAEDFALDYLRQKSFRLLDRNFRCKGGEIDLVMMDARELVFVEVRYRASDRFGDGGESVDYFKQRKLRIAAETWLQKNQALEFTGCRFDVMSISGAEPDFLVEWIDDAF